MDEKAIKSLPTYHWRDEPFQPPKHRAEVRRERFLRRYGIILILAACFTIYTILLSWIVHYRAMSLAKEQYENEFEAWKQEYIAENFFLTGEASRAAAIEQDAVTAAHDGGVWTTEKAYKTYCWNVEVRKRRADYPNSVQDVLQQTGQYAFHDPDGTYNSDKLDWGREVFQEAYSGALPQGLTLEHQFLEMRNNGAVCVLHTSYDFYTSKDDPWSYPG